MPLVSVIMASYNHEKYVGGAVQSVLDQTLQDFELVITDDGSRDGTAAQIEKFADPRIRFFRCARNRGQFVATNHCLKEARGEYLAILNSDDAFLPTKLEKQVRFLEDHPDVGAVFSRVQLIDEQDHVLDGRRNKMFLWENRSRFAWLNWFFHKGNCLCHPSVLIRRRCHEVVGNYDERYAQLADCDLWIRFCLRYEIYILPEELTAFRLLPQDANMSGKRPDSMIRSWWEYRRMLDHYLEIESVADLRRIFPEARRFLAGDDPALIPFAVAMMGLEKKGSTAFVNRAFALDTLFRLLGDPKSAEVLSQKLGFGCRDLIRLTGQYDVSNAFAVRQLRLERARSRQSLWRKVLGGVGKP